MTIDATPLAPLAPDAETRELVLRIRVTQVSGPFKGSEADTVDWVRACLNCNTNNRQVTVEPV